MLKTAKKEERTEKQQGRVLTRVLAQDLKKVVGGDIAAAGTAQTTIQGGTGDWDCTNVSWDGDAYEY